MKSFEEIFQSFLNELERTYGCSEVTEIKLKGRLFDIVEAECKAKSRYSDFEPRSWDYHILYRGPKGCTKIVEDKDPKYEAL